jgi:dTDP-4-dehydrorhamnose 3,5-epimerase
LPVTNRQAIQAIPQSIKGLSLLRAAITAQPDARFSCFHDDRDFEALGLPRIVQQHASRYALRHTVRGLHFQAPPRAQVKIVGVARGRIHDVVVDIRAASPTRGQHLAIELAAGDWTQLVVPPGFAHGFCTLEPDTEVVFRLSDFNDPALLRGLHWNDPALGIAWPCCATPARLLEVDQRWPSLADLASPF